MRAHLEYAHTLDPTDWERRNARGEVPDRLPYGLDRLRAGGIELSVSERSSARSGRVHRAAGRAARGLLRGVEPPALLRERRARLASDVVVCWDERSGATAALRSRLRGEPPVATGVIWFTERGMPRLRHVEGGLRSAAAVWALSSAQLPVLRERGIAPARLHHLPMGIDTSFWDTGEPDPDPELVVAVGNDRHRDHGTLIEAVARVRRKRPVRLALVTRQDVHVPAELGTRFRHRSHPELRRLYKQAAVVALAVTPNIHVSGLTTLLESMAGGHAVVATRTPGIDDYIRDGETGLLVEEGPEPLAVALEQLLNDPDRAAALGAAARREALARFTTTHQAVALAGILETARR